MVKHTHDFVNTYDGFVGIGLDRESDENTIIYYLQKFSDDELMKALVPRLSDEALNEVFSMITRLLKRYLSESEYHRLFLKDHLPR